MNESPVEDRPWRRPGARRYALGRLRGILRPEVTVIPAPVGLVKQQDVEIPMADGVILRVNVYRPAGSEPAPVLLCAHPYGKDALPRRTRWGWRINPQYRIMRQPVQVEISSETGWEAPDPVWWTQHGYAVVNCDVRGAGRSGGRGTVMSDQEAQDICAVITWIAGQPWSTGRVGMIGVSYLAISQYKAAALQPAGLVAICPWEGFTDAYRDLMSPGGIRENGFSVIWQIALRRAMRSTENFGAQRTAHPLRDEWWSAMVPDLRNIKVPMLICASFSDNDLHSRGSFRAFDQVSSADKFLYTHRGGKWATFYSADARRVQRDFLDRYLAQREAPALPTVRLEVRESAEVVTDVRNESEWPLARTRWRELHLAPHGMLVERAAAVDGQVTFHTRRSAACFDWVIKDDLELTGPMSLDLWVSVAGAHDVNLFIGVEKRHLGRAVPFEGSYGFGRDRVSTGWQKASLRELDHCASTSFVPVHTFTHPQPLTSDEIVPVQIALGPSATRFHRGDSIRLLIAGRPLASRNPLAGSFPAGWVRSDPARCTVHWGPTRQALLRVPEILPPRSSSVAT